MAKAKKKKSLAFKIFDWAVTIFLIAILIILLLNVIFKTVDKDYAPNIFGYQMYSIVTGSMEPTIPVGALVLSKSVSNEDIDAFIVGNERAEQLYGEGKSFDEIDEIIKAEGLRYIRFGTPIVFNAQYRGKTIVVTHYFDRFEKRGDEYFVYTYPEQFRDVYEEDGTLRKEHVVVSDRSQIIEYDGYQYTTKAHDIRAIYSTHITWLGKFLSFLRSVPGVITVVIIVIVLIGGSYLLKRVDKGKPDEDESAGGDLSDKDNETPEGRADEADRAE